MNFANHKVLSCKAAATGVFSKTLSKLVAALVLGAFIYSLGSTMILAQSPQIKQKEARQKGGQTFGFQQGKSDQPINIESDTLEVNDKDKYAIFAGNVIARQGEMTLQTKMMKVFYTGKGAADAATAPQGKGQESQNISKIEAHGLVVVTSKDQAATGDTGVYDLKTKVITLTASGGNAVVLTQGPNIVKGKKAIMNIATGVAKIDGSGRVQALFVPGSAKEAEKKQATQ